MSSSTTASKPTHVFLLHFNGLAHVLVKQCASTAAAKYAIEQDARRIAAEEKMQCQICRAAPSRDVLMAIITGVTPSKIDSLNKQQPEAWAHVQSVLTAYGDCQPWYAEVFPWCKSDECARHADEMRSKLGAVAEWRDLRTDLTMAQTDTVEKRLEAQGLDGLRQPVTCLVTVASTAASQQVHQFNTVKW